MWELAKHIPDVEVLLSLEPEELGAKLLFVHRCEGGMFHPMQWTNQFWGDLSGKTLPYPKHSRSEIDVALAEAWAWLEAQGLTIKVPGENGRAGWLMLSRRAKRFENEAEFSQYAVARMLRKESLHPKLAHSVWMAFMRGEFDVAVFQAMKTVEVNVREAAGMEPKFIGTSLMRAAFDPDKGPLSDMTSEKAEREALSALFAGAIGSYKNPQSHRHVQLTDPAEAVEIIILANHLLRIVDSRRPRSAD